MRLLLVVRAAVVSQIAGDVMATVTVLVATSAAEIEYLSDQFHRNKNSMVEFRDSN